MSTLYLEPFSGLSGDMLNALLLDLGADRKHLEEALKTISLDGYHLHVDRIAKSSIWGTDFDVHMEHGEKDHGIAGDFDHHHHDHEHEHHHHHEHEEHTHAHTHEHSQPHNHHHHDHEHTHDGHSHKHTHSHHHHHGEVRGLKEIETIILSSGVSDFVKEKSLKVFRDIAQAEANVHQMPVEEIHFHEVGATDSIIDIMSFFILWETLDIDTVYSTAVTEGSGTITVAHGVMPVPVPAVMQLRLQTAIPFSQDFDIHTELVTPTGLALFKAIRPVFAQPSNLTATKVGYGFGKRDTGKFNALRGTLLEKSTLSHQVVTSHNDEIIQIDTTIDDQSGEELGYIMSLLLEEGALDVHYTPVYTKKNRPATHLTLLIQEGDLERFTTILFKQTSTIGFRYQNVQRKVMTRTFETQQTSLGAVKVKKNQYGTFTKSTLEYEDCARIAHETGLSIQAVYQQLIKELH
ncbi:nickel pincer cofactor biosynthesis protein LarC [Granulicatella adiacens]|uniref:nickel pincer cofactor biosynthesis protein LarC n=1 Tax=Granulicatella adiacens TaxID=46124 RepID=UPI0021DAB2A2|nr:nickel pincer cofactor biosynthesis protein LarC [Granulicatella adiacens]UXY41329.1 nickel pincer cofactor biosynthesis protein LarC [Granulicatella adiacens]